MTFVSPPAVIIDLGYHTHAVSLDSKYVGLVSSYNAAAGTLTVTGREYLAVPIMYLSLLTAILLSVQRRISSSTLQALLSCKQSFNSAPF